MWAEDIMGVMALPSACGSETLPSTCNILSDESSIPSYFLTNLVYPFTLRVTGIINYSTSNGYNNAVILACCILQNILNEHNSAINETCLLLYE